MIRRDLDTQTLIIRLKCEQLSEREQILLERLEDLHDDSIEECQGCLDLSSENASLEHDVTCLKNEISDLEDKVSELEEASNV